MKKFFIPLLFTMGVTISCSKKHGEMANYPPNTSGKEKKWVVTTVAGEGTPFFADGAALQARFTAPQDVAVTPGGTIYVADGLNHRIRKIAGGQVTTFAGSETADTTSGSGVAARFLIPFQIVPDAKGNLYTLDVHDFRVRKLTSSALVTVVAGSGVRGFVDGDASIARFGQTSGIVTDEN